MIDEELVRTYTEEYDKEYEKYFKMANTFYDKAKDKQYALQLGLTIIQLLNVFRSKSEIEQRITETYEHIDKLGGTIIDIIRAIPGLIERQKELSEKWHKENKNELSFTYRKILGIPYWIKKINFKPKIRIGSPFESLESEEEIAKELARQRAIIDVITEFKNKYSSYLGIDSVKSELIGKLKKTIATNDLDKFFTLIQGIFANMPYDMKVNEGYFHSHIHLLLFLLDFEISSEVETNKGRIDSVIETDEYIHIIEFKLDSSKLAIEQIKEKEYYQKYFLSDKKIILVGVAVDAKDRNIKSWINQPYQ
jgi:hypothetical protein